MTEKHILVAVPDDRCLSLRKSDIKFKTGDGTPVIVRVLKRRKVNYLPDTEYVTINKRNFMVSVIGIPTPTDNWVLYKLGCETV